MRRQHFADFLNRVCQRMTEFFILKMEAHPVHNASPEFFSAFFVNRYIANNGEFVRSRRYENEDRIALAGLVHSQPLKFFLRNDKGIGIQFSALNKNANLAGRFRFSLPNRFNNPVMLEFVEKLLRAHFLPARSCTAATKTSASAAEPAASAARGPTTSTTASGEKYGAASAR
jgi:hypothetical protein